MTTSAALALLVGARADLTYHITKYLSHHYAKRSRTTKRTVEYHIVVCYGDDGAGMTYRESFPKGETTATDLTTLVGAAVAFVSQLPVARITRVMRKERNP